MAPAREETDRWFWQLALQFCNAQLDEPDLLDPQAHGASDQGRHRRRWIGGDPWIASGLTSDLL